MFNRSNTAGLEHTSNEIFNRFLQSEEDAEEQIGEYAFHEWYEIVEKVCFTPKSWIFPLFEFMNDVNMYSPSNICSLRNENVQLNNVMDEIDTLIASQLNNKQCFGRLDSVSSKPTSPYKNANEIMESLYRSSRTYNMIKQDTKLIIREWIPNIENEFRCFIHNGKLRGITCEYKENIDIYIEEIKNTVKNIIHYTDYHDCSIDFGFVDDNNANVIGNKNCKKLMLIEINTPVYLCASSGNFDLNLPSDYEVLLGRYIPDIITYPVIKEANVETLLDSIAGSGQDKF
jgi:hypothetical protein